MVEFGASIKLDSASATEQMRKFADRTTTASKALLAFQKETKATAQGGVQNVFRKYINSSQKANQQILKSITLIHDQRKAFSKLNDKEKETVLIADKLNQKYDESARNERNLINVRKELRIVTASGLKTQKEADIIYNKEAETLRKSTRLYKDNANTKMKAFNAGRENLNAIRAARIEFDKDYALNRKVAEAKRKLMLLLKKGIIPTRKEYNRILAETRLKLAAVDKENRKMISTQQGMAKAARIVSIYSRLLLGTYAAIRVAKTFLDFEKTAEAVRLLTSKLEFLTGESGAYKKFFSMTQEVGIKMEDANKIITRFAVVTNRAFSIDTMSEWSSTLIQSARATGTSTQEMTGALIQITQAMSAGRLMGDEYRSVTENLPLLTVALRDMFGRSTLSLKELSSQGLITNEVLIEAFGRTKILLKGFPDATDTIEASIGRLSSSWSNFTAKLSDGGITKSINNELSEFLVNIGDAIDRNTVRVAKARISLYEGRVSSAKKSLQSSLKTEAALESKNYSTKNIKRAIETKRKALIDVEKRLEARREALRKINGTSKGDLAAKAIDDKLQAKRKEDEAFKQEQISLQFIEKLNKGKSIQSIKQNATLQKNILLQKEKLFLEGKAGGIDPKLNTLATINKNEQLATDKVIKRQIDSELRLGGFTTRNNISKIEEELNASGKILRIRRKLIKDLKTVESARQARIIGLDKNQDKDKISKVTESKASSLNSRLKLKNVKDLKAEIDNITNSIDKITTTSLTGTAKLRGDIVSALGFDKTDIVAQYDKSIILLEKSLKKLSGTESELAKRGTSVAKIREKAITALKDNAKAATEKKDVDFTSSLEQKFDSGAVAVRAYNTEIIALTAAKDTLNLSEFEHNRQLDLLNANMQDQVNQSKSLRGELTFLEQTTFGIGKGMRDFKNNAKTAFEVVATSTESLFDGMVDSMVTGGEQGQKAFKQMTESVLKDIQRMIIKSLILKAINAVFGGGSSTPKDTGSFFQGEQGADYYEAKGGVYSGSGISEYSNTVVNKPTMFAFAKGAAVMGEAGSEAIMPLTRMASGELGVGIKGGGGSVQNNVSVTINIDQNGESKTEARTGEGNGKKLGDVLSNLVNLQLIKEMRPGGLLNQRGNR